jgi:hypothetical protein
MLAHTSRLGPVTQSKPGSDGQALRPAVRRGALLPALAATGEDGPPCGAAFVPLGLLEYAAFVLDQEARYCQR